MGLVMPIHAQQTGGIPMAGNSDVKVRFDASGRPYSVVSTSSKDSSFSNMSHYQYLKQYIPNIQPSDVDRIGSSDLRNLYYKAIRAQGMSMSKARELADKISL
jgi:hypothetical protein